MKLVFTPRAESQLANQFDYGVQHFGERAARSTLDRFRAYLEGTILQYPRLSRYHSEIDAYETWIPRTPFVIFYRLDEANGSLIVLAVFHHAQNRQDFSPN